MSTISETQRALNNARKQIVDAFMATGWLSDKDSSRLQHMVEGAVQEIDSAIVVLEKFRHHYEEVPPPKKAKAAKPRSRAA
jgi:hypothetical protein